MKTLTPGKKSSNSVKSDNSVKSNNSVKPAKAAPKVESKRRYTVEVGDYNGHPTLTFTDNQAQNPKWAAFSMGVSKLRAVVACLDDVKEFLAANQPKTGK